MINCTFETFCSEDVGPLFELVSRELLEIIFTFAFALTGCASVKADKETASISTETIVSTDDQQAPTAEPDNETTENITGISTIYL